MTQTALQWQAEWQKGMEDGGKGICPCRQVLLIADLSEAAAVRGIPVADCEIEMEARR